MSVGFISTDPKGNDLAGYRSWSLSRKAAGGLLEGSDVTYNGFTFPPTLQAKASVVPEYNKARTSVKWHTVVLTLECYISQYDVDIFSAANPTIDSHMDEIRTRLMQPCQQLSFTLQGFGSFQMQAPSTNNAAPEGFLYDVNFGPKPQVLEWAPIAGGLCAKVQWLVTASVPPCGPDGAASGLKGVVDLWYEVSWGIGDAGFLARKISGGIELAGTRSAILNSVHASNTLDVKAAKDQYDLAMAFLGKSFPPLGGFERVTDFRMSADKRSLQFTFSDEEVPAPQAYPEGVLRARLTETVSSSMDEAFYRWQWSMSGSFEVPNSKHASDMVNNKRLAFAAFGLIVRDRLDRLKGFTVQNQVPRDTPSMADYDLKDRRAYAIPQSIRVSNELYGNSITVDLSYLITCEAGKLWKAIGFFDAIRSMPGLTWKNWRAFLEKSGSRVSFIDILPNTEIIVDLCHPLAQSASPGQESTRRDINFGDSIFRPIAPAEEDSWLSYYNKFSFKTQHFTEAGVLLSEEAHELYQYTGDPLRANTGEESQKLIPVPVTSQTPKILDPDLQTSAEPITYVTMYGSAARIGYPIAAPILVSVGGKPAALFGKDYLVPSSRPSGFTKDGKQVNMYQLQWRRTYIIKGAVQGWNVNSTGHPQIFQ